MPRCESRHQSRISEACTTVAHFWPTELFADMVFLRLRGAVHISVYVAVLQDLRSALMLSPLPFHALSRGQGKAPPRHTPINLAIAHQRPPGAQPKPSLPESARKAIVDAEKRADSAEQARDEADARQESWQELGRFFAAAKVRCKDVRTQFSCFVADGGRHLIPFTSIPFHLQ